jgi:hypothetical protein
MQGRGGGCNWAFMLQMLGVVLENLSAWYMCPPVHNRINETKSYFSGLYAFIFMFVCLIVRKIKVSGRNDKSHTPNVNLLLISVVSAILICYSVS